MSMLSRDRKTIQRMRRRGAADAPASMTIAEPNGTAGIGVIGTLAEARLVVTAMSRDYPIDENRRKSIVDTAVALLDAAQERTRLAACKVLLAADALNLGRERLASEERRPGAVVNVFDRAQVLLQQLASAPTSAAIAPIAQDASPGDDLPAGDAKAS